MKAHVQNPWTNKPSLMVNLSIEEAQQLDAALWYLTDDSSGDDPTFGLTPNQKDAVTQLQRTLKHAFSTALPHGVKGVVP